MVPWESSQHARTLAAVCPVRLATTDAGDPAIAANGLHGSETTIRPRLAPHPHHPPKKKRYELGSISIYLEVAKAKVGARRRGAVGSGAAARTREAAVEEAARPRTAARREREAAPRHAIA